jgi:hypothetical protein
MSCYLSHRPGIRQISSICCSDMFLVWKWLSSATSVCPFANRLWNYDTYVTLLR